MWLKKQAFWYSKMAIFTYCSSQDHTKIFLSRLMHKNTKFYLTERKHSCRHVSNYRMCLRNYPTNCLKDATDVVAKLKHHPFICNCSNLSLSLFHPVLSPSRCYGEGFKICIPRIHNFRRKPTSSSECVSCIFWIRLYWRACLSGGSTLSPQLPTHTSAHNLKQSFDEMKNIIIKKKKTWQHIDGKWLVNKNGKQETQGNCISQNNLVFCVSIYNTECSCLIVFHINIRCS